MRKAESVFSLLLTLLSIGYLYFVWKMDVGNLMEPGPGFMPAVVGGMALTTSVLIFLGSLKRPAEAKPPSGEASTDGKRRFAATVAAIAVFIPLFQFLGSILSIFFVVFLINKILGAKGWLQPLLLASICAVVTYVVFVLALDVPLPRGIL
jgi:hypothetical protein